MNDVSSIYWVQCEQCKKKRLPRISGIESPNTCTSCMVVRRDQALDALRKILTTPQQQRLLYELQRTIADSEAAFAITTLIAGP